MRSFQERNRYVLGGVGAVVVVAVVLLALNYDRLPLVSGQRSYSAFFAEAGGLTAGAAVQVSGFEVGEVGSIVLDGARVLVSFEVDNKVRLGDRTEAAIRTKSLLGSKVLELTPRGADEQSGPIPVERTTSPYQLPVALGDLTAQISGLDTGQLSGSLSTLADTFRDTPPDLQVAVAGVTRFSETLDKRDTQLRNLLTNAEKATTILADRTGRIVGLIHDSNALLVALQAQSAELDQIARHITDVSTQVEGFIAENRDTFKPALDKLNAVLTIVDNRKVQVQQSISGFSKYLLSLSESLASGPFFKAYLVNLLPGQFIQPFVDAAFSDLGLDPHVLLPSQRTDPQIGQPGTPALTVPFPRTGQGGGPNLTLPDAITGRPGDARYPYREPLPAPAPGGPPPGPPAAAPTSESGQ
ncbi:MAG: MCE family protein [Mycobacterium sp.]